MLTILFLLIISAFVTTVLAGMGKCPLWIPVFILCVVALFQVLPVR